MHIMFVVFFLECDHAKVSLLLAIVGLLDDYDQY